MIHRCYFQHTIINNTRHEIKLKVQHSEGYMHCWPQQKALMTIDNKRGKNLNRWTKWYMFEQDGIVCYVNLQNISMF